MTNKFMQSNDKGDGILAVFKHGVRILLIKKRYVTLWRKWIYVSKMYVLLFNVIIICHLYIQAESGL